MAVGEGAVLVGQGDRLAGPAVDATTSVIVEETSWLYAPTFWMGVAPAEPGMPARHSTPARPASTVRATASVHTSPAASSSRVPSREKPLVAMTRAVPSKPLSPMTRF
ncbi:hypothetical protein SPURM210S_05521 [Streptomyces purpurascens]